MAADPELRVNERVMTNAFDGGEQADRGFVLKRG